jgi:DNA-binding NtrC family response regulator
MVAFLARRLEEETAWARRIVVSMCASMAALRQGRVAWATKVCVRGRQSYEALRRLERQKRPDGPRPRLLVMYEDHCRLVLRSFSPPLRSGKYPVRALAAAARQLPPARRTSRVRTTIAALDALVAVGRGRESSGLHERVVRELARMLGARVLLHYERGGYRSLEDQRRHTLSTWSIRCLVRERALRARRIRPRPEFWRPEQERPRGLLSFPIGDGTACLARRRAFGPSDVEAARVVLGFLAQRLAEAQQKDRSTPARTPAPRALPDRHRPVRGIVGDSAPWRRVMADVWRVGRGDVPVLLLGETGTGKEVVARALHLTSGRAQRPFVAASCATLRGDTLLSELFGHVKGAFSGAVRSHKGLFERAHRGTLFLDELAEAPYELQVALLRVLQDGVVRPVGSVRSKDVSVRVVAATNRDLDAARRDGRFREDLYHRLAAITIDLPPLRERLDDLPALVRHLLARHAPDRALHADALTVLAGYDWPGNVRELENMLRASALLCDDLEIPASTVRQVLEGRREARQRAARPSHLAPRTAAVLDALRAGWWSTPELSDRLGIAPRTLNRELRQLASLGHVEHVGEAKARRYRRTR